VSLDLPMSHFLRSDRTNEESTATISLPMPTSREDPGKTVTGLKDKIAQDNSKLDHVPIIASLDPSSSHSLRSELTDKESFASISLSKPASEEDSGKTVTEIRHNVALDQTKLNHVPLVALSNPYSSHSLHSELIDEDRLGHLRHQDSGFDELPTIEISPKPQEQAPAAIGHTGHLVHSPESTGTGLQPTTEALEESTPHLQGDLGCEARSHGEFALSFTNHLH